MPLVVQEQNSYPGVTNRLLARHAEVIFTAFKDADEHLPEGKTRLIGNPTRRELREAGREESLEHFGFDDHRPVLLVLGGSGGARTINAAMKAHIGLLHDELGIQVIWQCGPAYFDELRRAIAPGQYPRLLLTDFLHHMPQAYGAADLVVSRAGALSCSELALTGKPSVLVPSPNVAGDHQTRNARSMAQAGAAVLLPDGEARDVLGELVRKLMDDEQRLKAMNEAALGMARPGAAEEIAQEILKLTREQRN
ncbi:MAG: UDP-N-acetylglucosamine--N-acetylmuramyl-(pentapeptide) pyrophosphoryl-undecaprenol N-acetylglucosamine transferase [Balneolaceae bacterium]|nr:UDP-N-acetylglucosamine--N-acetylmuramyl-(pentapeptide) pyrophosphoryl-undecaprenol N-acetylglucosamine transferase [Balneolaceae bacterium]